MAGGPWGAFFKGGIHKGPQRPAPALLDVHTHCSEAAGSTVPWKDTAGAGTGRISPRMLPFARARERVCSPWKRLPMGRTRCEPFYQES